MQSTRGVAIIIIIIIHEFQSDASPEELQGRCSVTVFSLWLWPVMGVYRYTPPPKKKISLHYKFSCGYWLFFSLTQDTFDIVPVCALARVSFTYLHTTIYTPPNEIPGYAPVHRAPSECVCAEYCHGRVSVSDIDKSKIHQILSCVLPRAVVRSFSDGSAIRCVGYIRFCA